VRRRRRRRRTKMSSSSVRDGEDNGSDDDARAGIEKSLTAAFASRAVQLAQAVRNRRSLVSALKDHPELAAQKHGRGVEAVLSFWEGGNQAAERRRAVTKRVLAESRAKASAAALVAIFTDPAPQLSSLEDFVERRAGAPAQPPEADFLRISEDTPVGEGLQRLGAAMAGLKSKLDSEATVVVERAVRPEDRLHERDAAAGSAGSPRVSFYKRAAEKIAADLAALREAEAATAAAAAAAAVPSPAGKEPWRPASRSPSPPPPSAPPSRAATPTASARRSGGPPSRAATPAATARSGGGGGAAAAALAAAPANGEGAGGGGGARPSTSGGGRGGGGGGGGGAAAGSGGSGRAGPSYWPSDAPLLSAFPSPPRDAAFDAEFSVLLKDHVDARNQLKREVMKKDYSPQKLVDGHVE
jgi:hypothetical protein